MKKNLLKLLLISSSILLLSGCSFSGTIDTDNNVDENNNQQENNSQEEKDNVKVEEEYNYTEISNLINEKLSYIISIRGYDKNGINILNTADTRVLLINYLLSNDAQETYEGQGRIISYDKYNSKYKEVYGNNYSLETDLSNVSSKTVAVKEENNIAWNATMGVSGYEYKFTAQNITNNSDSYTITGIYTKTNASDNSTINGTFEIQYVRKDNVNNLQSIILTDK